MNILNAYISSLDCDTKRNVHNLWLRLTNENYDLTSNMLHTLYVYDFLIYYQQLII